jgi:hypothetical protein
LTNKEAEFFSFLIGFANLTQILHLELDYTAPPRVNLTMHRARLKALGTILLLQALLFSTESSAAHKAADRSHAAAITFSPRGGVFTNAISLQISSPTADSAVRYTLDGSEPTPSSPLYNAPVAITNTALVRAKLFRAATNDGPTVSETYTFIEPEIANFDSNLPLLILNTFGQEVEKENKVAVSARLVKPVGSRCSIFAPAEFDGRALLNLRGRASLRYPKRSYTFRPIDESDEYAKVSLLGMPSDSDWVLYAPYPDKTFMRDVLAYELSNQMGQYASRTRFVEAFVNDTHGKLNKLSYVGVYVLEEKIRRSKDRVDIEKLGPEDNAYPKITGGYIFKKDHAPDGGEAAQANLGGFPGMQGSTSSNRLGFPTGPGGFPADPAGFLPPYNGPMRESTSSSSSSRRTSSGSVTNRIGLFPEERDMDDLYSYRLSSGGSSSSRERFLTKQTNELYYVHPGADEITAPQKAWLTSYVNQFETALYGKNFTDPTNGYAAYIDPASFIDHHILVEMSKNVDGFRFSTYFHKDRGAPIKMGPIWDWNLSFGNANGKQGWIPEYWLWPQLTDKEYSWFRRLFQDPDFGQRYVDRWAQLRTNIFVTDKILARIDHWTNLLNEAQIRNYEKWQVLGRQVWPQNSWGDTYGDEVIFMKDWIKKRLAWIDAQFLPAPALASPKAGEFTLTASKGEIYYTLDGSDPRASGGTPSGKAVKYDRPLSGKSKLTLHARCYQNGRWSAPTMQILR